MYIPAVPKTPMNLEYVVRQRECFAQGERPSDFPKGSGEKEWGSIGTVDDILSTMGKVAMAWPV